MNKIERNINNVKLKKAVESLRLEFPNAEVAEKMKLDPGNVSSYLNNKKPVSANFIRKFEKAFNLNINDFSTLENKPPPIEDASLHKIIELQAKEIEFLRELLLKK